MENNGRYFSGYDSFQNLAEAGEILPNEIIEVRSTHSGIDDRQYIVGVHVDGYITLEDSFGKTRASKILKNRLWKPKE